MREPIENEYFNWLCAKVLERNTRMYYDLLRILYTTEFVWVIPNDENRSEDAKYLRIDFARETNTPRDLVWESQPASVLEVIYAFAIRAAFQTDTPEREWFWVLMENLHLDQFRQVSGDDALMIEEIVDRFIWRTYEPHGYGGLFPMTQTTRDQRKLEIWHQFCEYVVEQGLF